MMKFQHSLSALTLAVAAALPMMLPTAVQAQPQARAMAGDMPIESFGVQALRRLSPGSVLEFSLNGVPGATVTAQIVGAGAEVTMDEVRPGHYEGSYTIRQRDRLTAASTVTARVMKNGRLATASLSQSLLAGARPPVPVVLAQINAFNVTAPDRVRPGDELMFSLTGTPGGQASVTLPGIDKRIALSEVRRGVYEGTYVLRRQDRARGELLAEGHLLASGRDTMQRFERVVARGDDRDRRDERDGRDPRDVRDGRDVRPAAAISCATCGAIESINRVEVKSGSPNVLGTIAGGVIGGVVGNQVGGGSGKDLATIAGAIGGAYAGNRVQNNMDKQQVYRVTVRLDAGATQAFDYAQDPAVTVGTRVKVDNGALIRL